MPIKVVKFIRRVSSRAGDALRMVMRIDQLPSGAKLRLLEELSSSGVSRLRAAGSSDDAIIRLGKAGDGPGSARRRARRAAAVHSGGFVAWRTAETSLRSLVGAAPKAKGFATIVGGRGTTGYRFVDAWDPITRIAREAKTGYTG